MCYQLLCGASELTGQVCAMVPQLDVFMDVEFNM